MKKGFTLVEIMVTTVIVGIVVIGLVKFSQTFFSGYEFSFQETQAISEAQQSIIQMERELREMRDGEEGSYPLSVANDTEVVFFSDVNDDGGAERVRYYLVGSDLVKQVFEFDPDSSNYACVGGCDICHNPGPGEGTISIPDSSWPAHRAHGDYMGACQPGGGGGGGGSSSAWEKTVASYIQNTSDPIFYYYNSDWPSDVVNNPLAAENRLLDTRLMSVGVRVNVNPNINPNDFSVSTFIHLRNLKDNL
ncbi:prepilin-type N-terminal cleavage/methylation domain-containing protein [Patescibacteria group bacterium]